MNQPADGQRQPDDQHQQRQQRRHRDGEHFGMRAIGELTPEQDQPGERQIDQARPVDVRPGWEIEFVLAKIVPALPAVEPRTNLTHAHIVVGIAEHETGDVGPFGIDQPGREQQPGKHRQAAPASVDKGH